MHPERTDISTLFELLSRVTEELQEDMRRSELDAGNPLLTSLKRCFQSSLCGIWDVWEPLAVEVGDVGVLQGRDKLRPTFKKFANVAHEMEELSVDAPPELWYTPDPSFWSTSTSSDGSIR
jgi:hypothetical protein